MEKKKKTGILSFWQKTAFGVGGTADNLMQNGINNMANQVFNIFLGVNPVLVSIAIFAARLWDAFTDPTMGSISDNTRSRFGRRRPYILVGGILSALTFALLWWVPASWPETGHFLWFLFGSILFYTFYTVFSVPFNALSYELTSSYHERTKVMAFRCFFGAIAGISIQWMFRLTQMDCFENTLDGMRTVSLYVAAIILGTSIIPAVFSKERFSHAVSTQQKIRLIDSLKVTLKNRTFTLLIAALILICLGLFMVGQLGVYVNIFYVFGGDKKTAATIMGFGGLLYHLTGGIIAAPIISAISGRFGKKKTLMGGLILATVGSGATFFTYNPQWPYLQFVSLMMMSPGLSCLWILTPSMVADICDEDELHTGVRREGMYGAVYSNVMKIGVSVGLLFVGFILNTSGFRAELGAAQPAQALMVMRVCYAVIPVTGLLLGLLCISRYKITAERSAEVRMQLDARHAAATKDKEGK
jgi:GPH family glycoside/pentoside/hexuronide:cation symporter